MRPGDISGVMRIEKASFPAPWPRVAFLEEIHNPYARIVLAGRDQLISGYICYWILGEELLINNLAVDPARRRTGLGRRLLRHAFDEALDAGCGSAYLEVRPSNAAALALYADFGFHAIQRRRGYYSDTGEDALVMRAALKGLESG